MAARVTDALPNRVAFELNQGQTDDRVKFLADTTNCYWLLDVVASLQRKALWDVHLREFQLWELVVRPDRAATVVCLRDADDEAFDQRIHWTDFPFDYVPLYVENGVILPPSEH